MSVNLNYKAVEDGFCFQKDDRVLVLAFTGGNAENKPWKILSSGIFPTEVL